MSRSQALRGGGMFHRKELATRVAGRSAAASDSRENLSERASTTDGAKRGPEGRIVKPDLPTREGGEGVGGGPRRDDEQHSGWENRPEAGAERGFAHRQQYRDASGARQKVSGRLRAC